MKFSLTIISFIFILFSCSKSSSRIEQALQFAGKNRPELEKVLHHYQANPEDSLKYKAAFFLIENMPVHYFYQSEKLEYFKQKLIPLMKEMNCSSQDALKKLMQTQGPLSLNDSNKVYDSHVITSGFLIRNIDLSFKVWKEVPWGKYLSFEDFCEDILPYRIKDEPLQDWKSKYYEHFQPVLDSLLKDNSPLTAAKLLSLSVQNGWIYEENLPFPHLGADILLEHKYGSCRDASDMGTYAMRSVGIPSGIDYFIKSPDRVLNSHLWNYVRDTTGKSVEFNFMWYTEGYLKRKKGKVYRYCYGIQENSLPFILKGTEIPTSFKNILIKDVSEDYFKGVIELPINNIKNNKILYLGVFKNNSWIPIAWSKVENKKISFQYVEPNVCYLVIAKDSDKYKPISAPIIVDSKGNFHTVEASNNFHIEMMIKRKYPLPFWWKYAVKRFTNTQIQGSSNPEFKNSITFNTVKEVDMNWHTVPVLTNKEVKYIRFTSIDSGYISLAEMNAIGSRNGEILTGDIIGSELSKSTDDKIHEKAAFDGDPLTYYETKEGSRSWVGLAFQKPETIKEIRFLFRNDDNNIRIGDEYELVYWEKNGWVSMGRKMAETNQLTYKNVPSGALYLLHNHTRGKEERPFSYENGQQIWW